LVEQLAFNQWVAGSSPARLTTFSRQKQVMRLVAKPAAFRLWQFPPQYLANCAIAAPLAIIAFAAQHLD
jgi:hypothetical protein